MESWGFAPNPTYFYFLTKKVCKKSQGCARLARKSYAWRLKNLNLRLAPLSASNSRFFLRRLRLFFGSPDDAALQNHY